MPDPLLAHLRRNRRYSSAAASRRPHRHQAALATAFLAGPTACPPATANIAAIASNATRKFCPKRGSCRRLAPSSAVAAVAAAAAVCAQLHGRSAGSSGSLPRRQRRRWSSVERDEREAVGLLQGRGRMRVSAQ
eukprot:354519-Chlamydomonas_euryale.AAC.10